MKMSLTKTDRRLIACALLALLLVAPLLISQEYYNFVFGSRNNRAKGSEIGQVILAKHDIRLKDSMNFDWNSASVNANIYSGDSLFVGRNSNSQVSLKRGGKIDLGENTMVTFTETEGEIAPGLQVGNFKITVQGKMKVILDGKLTEFVGNGAELEVSTAPGSRTKVKVTKGNIQLKRKNELQKLKTISSGQTEFLDERGTASVANLPPEPAVVVPPPLVAVEPPPPARYAYTYKIEDFYRVSGSLLWVKPAPPTEVNFKVSVPVAGQTGSEKMVLQQSAEKEFKSQHAFETTAASLELPTAYLGSNYLRTTKTGSSWKPAGNFDLDAAFVPEMNLQFVFDQEQVPLLTSEIAVVGHVVAQKPYPAYILETSLTPQFAENETSATMLTTSQRAFIFRSAVTRYYRIRGINDQNEITDLSPIAKLNIFIPETAEPPRLTQYNFEGLINKPLPIAWEKTNAKTYEVEIRDRRGEVIYTQKTTEPKFVWNSERAGPFKLDLTQIDRFGRRSKSSSARILMRRPEPPPALVLAKKVEPPPKLAEPAPERAPAQVATTTGSLNPNVPNYLNKKFESSKLEVEASTNLLQSSQQVVVRSTTPIIAALAVRMHAWLGHHGFEGSMKSKVLGFNDAGGSMSTTQLEARYHYRVFAPFNVFSTYERSQFSGFIGYEMFRNNGSNFAPQYNLLKLGTAMSFPLSQRWDTGGEFVFGTAADASKKYEISGNIHYYLQKDWSLGVGYRVHYFVAGSKASAPSLGLPYREGYSEGYSVLRWHY